ncbi:hypothetical protein QC762_0090450 [Podospora pseudocomata]|uniref:Uncharacterized protein n=1 Tax=Podospora pseudocomata TaxID=2093779 RepID=A0ABR0G6H2_9PEZI|nr:hypothetical protein QC762_0090450 [Podospora pseudocomata]
MTFTYPTCSPIAFWHRRTAPSDQMANNSLIQSANFAHSHDHEYLSGRPSDEDLKIEINAFRRNTIDFLASYLATREAIAHNHSPGNHMNGSNSSTDITKALPTPNKFITLIATHDQLQMQLVPLRNILHQTLHKAWIRLLRSNFYLVSSLLLKLTTPLLTTNTPLSILLSILLAASSADTLAYRTLLYLLLSSKTKDTSQIKARLDEESSFFKQPDTNNPDFSAFIQTWLLTADDLVKLGAKCHSWIPQDDDERQQLMTGSHGHNPITTSESDRG